MSKNRLPPEYQKPLDPPPIDAPLEESFQSYLEHAFFGKVHDLPEKMIDALRSTYFAGAVVCLAKTMNVILENPDGEKAVVKITEIRDEINAHADMLQRRKQ